jgi:hypothetical protein
MLSNIIPVTGETESKSITQKAISSAVVIVLTT